MEVNVTKNDTLKISVINGFYTKRKKNIPKETKLIRHGGSYTDNYTLSDKK